MERRIARMSSAPVIGRQIKQHSVGLLCVGYRAAGQSSTCLRRVQNCRPPPSHDTPRSAQVPHECAGSCPARALRLMGVPLRG